MGLAMLCVFALVLSLVWLQFRGTLERSTRVTVIANRSGLSLDIGAKVTYHGVRVGKVMAVRASDSNPPAAEITVGISPVFLPAIPANADVVIRASTLFGNKYVEMSTPDAPSSQRISDGAELHALSVTTEVNTLFETVTAVAEVVDPIKLNQTLTAVATALDGLGDRLGDSVLDGNEILTDVNPLMPQLRRDLQSLAAANEIYADVSDELFRGLESAASTAHTLNDQRLAVDRALVAAIGLGNSGADVVVKGSPYLVQWMRDQVPTTGLLDEYSPELFCTIRNYHDVGPKIATSFGGNGYSTVTRTELLGPGNPYVYPDNLPRVNASGGPEGRPGCWQPVTRDLWPAPYLVMDTGASIAPYNHLELGQPLTLEYVWGRQIGENTINP